MGGELLEPGLSVSLCRRAPIRKPGMTRAVRKNKMTALSLRVDGVQFLVRIMAKMNDARSTVTVEANQNSPRGACVFRRKTNEAAAGNKIPKRTTKRSATSLEIELGKYVRPNRNSR